MEHPGPVNLVHVTHEAVHKIGGIGAVLEGLLTAASYDAAVQRTVLVGPLFSTEGAVGTASSVFVRATAVSAVRAQ